MVHVRLEKTAFTVSGTQLGYPSTEHGLGVELFPFVFGDANLLDLLDVVAGAIENVHHDNSPF